jgi:hypothetical protein
VKTTSKTLTLLALLSCAGLSSTASSQPIRAYQIGNSITYRCTPQLGYYGIQANAVVGRQFVDGISLAFSLFGKLPPVVIIELGTNGPPRRANVRSMMSALRLQRHVFFITVREPRSWEGETNRVLWWARWHYKTVRIINWYKFSRGHMGWLEDGIHPTIAAGCEDYARLENQVLRANNV